MKTFFKHFGATIGAGLSAIALTLIIVNLNKAGVGPVSSLLALPFLVVLMGIGAQLFPNRFLSFFVFTFVVIFGGNGEGVEYELKKRHVLRFFLAFAHILCWLGLILIALFASVSTSFWVILAVSSIGVLFPFAYSDPNKLPID